jgi:signal transduction histidine kinase
VTEKDNQALQNAPAKTVFDTGVYFADLIHEIRNPLNGMDTTLQLMGRHLSKNGTEEDPVMRSYVQDLRKEARRINNTLVEAQAFWRADFQLEAVQITDLVGELQRTGPLHHEIQGIHVQVEVPRNLPCVHAHEKLLYRALLNLIKNAIEAMPGGGNLILRAKAQNRSVVIEIIDTGVGIPPDLEIFDAFTTSKPGGMGLGLSIVQRIAGALNGEVAYSSQPGNGTTFRLSLPQWKKDTVSAGEGRKRSALRSE